MAALFFCRFQGLYEAKIFRILTLIHLVTRQGNALKKSISDAVSFAPKRGLLTRKYDISYVLAHASHCRDVNQRVEWLESLLAWVRSSSALQHGGTKPDGPPLQGTAHVTDDAQASTRIKFILHLCERNPDWQSGVSTNLQLLATELPATELFCDVGLSAGQGLFGQLCSIIIERYLPVKGRSADLDQLVTDLFPNDSDVSWVHGLPATQMKQLLSMIEGEKGTATWAQVRRSFADAMLILASQATGASTEKEMRERVPLGDLPTSTFFRLQMTIGRLHPRLEGSKWVAASDLRELAELKDILKECLESVDQAFAFLELHGVSVELVFRFERMESILKRLALMTDFLITAAQGVPEAGISHLLAELIRASLDAHGLSRIFRGKIRLLSRRIVNHTGDSGDHYIRRDRAGYMEMLRSAGGGGFLTVFTTLLKATIARFTLPPMIEALAHASNYAGSFLTMHFCHFTLATKQPSMTASSLARKLSEFARGTDSQEIIETIRDLVRSQVAAAIGNVGVAVPTAAILTWIYKAQFGQQILTTHYAEKTLHSLDPLTTLTVPFAILTGFLLWVSSLISGAVENWVALHQIAERIKHSRQLRSWFGAPKIDRMVLFFTRNLPGATGSIILGFLLALTPFIGNITGLALDVRHVTLSSSALSMAVVTLGSAAPTPAIIRAALGVFLTGTMNFGISFFLALVVASRAQNVRRGLLRLIGRRVARTFFASPLSFVWPRAKTITPSEKGEGRS